MLRKNVQDFRLSLAETKFMCMRSIGLATAVGLAGLACSTPPSGARSGKPAVVESPGGALAANLVYSPTLGRVLALVGSAEPISSAHDSIAVWSWDGSRWQRMSGSGPLMRRLAAADYDASRRRLMLHGGLRNEPSLHSLDELWEWDGESWSRRDPTLQAVRDHHYLVHDPSRATSVMFGGGGRPLGTSQWIWPRETWEWNGLQWSRLEVPGPSPRGRGAMIYDAPRNEVMLFGGVSAPDSAGSQHYLGDTWRWNGTRWNQAADTGPAPRNAHAMAFDDGRGVALLYGGEAGSRAFVDLWEWDGDRWREIPLQAPNPGPRYSPGLAFDSRRGRLVLYGGLVHDSGGRTRRMDDTWEWDAFGGGGSSSVTPGS
jgi:hypothetical protein